VRTNFARPAAAALSGVVLFIGDVAPGQQVYVNGSAVTPRLEDGMDAIDLDPAQLSESNTLAIVFATPNDGTRKRFDEAQGGKRWATLRTATPAGPWQRSVFNGYAQVILQPTGQPGRDTARSGRRFGGRNPDTGNRLSGARSACGLVKGWKRINRHR